MDLMIQPLSQRNTKWANVKLGTSNTTIGSHGCTITCVAMLLGTNPEVVNSRLNDVGGYLNGNLVIWKKLEEAFPQLPGITRARYFNRQEVDDNLPCLVEVDFDGSPRTDDKHWVVYEDGQMVDPWTGRMGSRDKYKIRTGFAIMKVNTEVEPSISNKAYEACMEDRARFWKQRDEARTDTQKFKDEVKNIESVCDGQKKRLKKDHEEAEKAMRVKLAERTKECQRLKNTSWAEDLQSAIKKFIKGKNETTKKS